MRLSAKHLRIINHFVLTGNKDESYRTEFPTVKSTATSHHFFNKPEIKEKVEEIMAIRDIAYTDGIKKTLEKMSEQVASEIEIDVFHTSVLRGQIMMIEHFAVREKRFNEKNGVIEDVAVIKKIERPPTIKEKQISASELYKRRGSYKAVQRVQIEQDDTKSAEIAKSGSQDIMRVVILSNGERLPIL